LLLYSSNLALGVSNWPVIYFINYTPTSSLALFITAPSKCDAISDNMTTYRNLYYYLEGTFDGCEVSHVSRASNEEVDNLANIGSQCLPIPQGVFWEEIIERSIKSSKVLTAGEQVQIQTNGSGADNRGTAEPEEVMMIEETWMQPYLAYMVNKTLPEDTVQVKRIIR
jgi:hypothetical protein